MAAKKTSSKKASSKKAASKKAAPKKAASKKTASKKAGSKKPASKKTTARAKAPEKASAKKAAGISSLSINMGHVFALRPRLSTTFRPGDFATAKHQLRDEEYANTGEAARAVAEKALELTHDSNSPRGSKRGRF